MSNKVMSKQELLDNKEELVKKHYASERRSHKSRTLTKKERKVLGIGKDEGKAIMRHVRVSPFKAKLVCDLVRGKNLQEAKAILTYANRGAAAHVLKLVKSAEANAVNNNGLNAEDLFISEIQVSPGPIMKRWRARGKGSASRINKRTCHISTVVREKV